MAMIGPFGWRLAMAVVCLALVGTVYGAPGANLLPNGSFENPNGWETRQWSGKATWELTNQSHTGKQSAMIASDVGADFSLVANVAVDPFAAYRLSAWLKTEDVRAAGGLGAMINIHDFDCACHQL